jgi:hypothetical protein
MPVSEDLDEAIAAQIGQRTPATDRTGAASCRNAPRSAEACGRWCNQGVEVVGAPSRGRTGTTEVEGFSCHFGFRRHRDDVRGLDFVLTVAAREIPAKP